MSDHVGPVWLGRAYGASGLISNRHDEISRRFLPARCDIVTAGRVAPRPVAILRGLVRAGGGPTQRAVALAFDEGGLAVELAVVERTPTGHLATMADLADATEFLLRNQAVNAHDLAAELGKRRHGAMPARSCLMVIASARNSSQVRRPTARSGARIAPARTARAAWPGSRTSTNVRCLPVACE